MRCDRPVFEPEHAVGDLREAIVVGHDEARATVLVGEAHDPSSLDTSELKSRLEDAEQRLSELDEDEDSAQYQTAEQDRARAEAFLQIAEG